MPGDLSELRPLLVVGTFVAVFVLLTALMASTTSFMMPAISDRTNTPPDIFDAVDLAAYANTLNGTFDDHSKPYNNPPTYNDDWHLYGQIETLGGQGIWIASNYDENKIVFWHHEKYWIFTSGGHYMNFIATHDSIDVGHYLTGSILDHYDSLDSLSFRVKCDHFQVNLFLAYNHTAYSLASQAWQNDMLYFLVGIEFDQVNTSFDLWGVISMLLWFQMPTTGVTILTNIIRIPFWIATVYLAVVFIIKIMGAIFGGG